MRTTKLLISTGLLMASWWWRLNVNCRGNARTHICIHYTYGACTGTVGIGVRSAQATLYGYSLSLTLKTMLIGTDATAQQQKVTHIPNCLLYTRTQSTNQPRRKNACVMHLTAALLVGELKHDEGFSWLPCRLLTADWTAFLRYKSSCKKLWRAPVGQKQATKTLMTHFMYVCVFTGMSNKIA